MTSSKQLHEATGLHPYHIANLGSSLGYVHDIYDERGLADLGGLTKKLGGNIVIYSNYNLNQELISVYEEGDFNVYIAHNTSHAYDKYLIARALGHYSLHFLGFNQDNQEFERPRQAIFRRKLDDKLVQDEAEWFACGLILPYEAMNNYSDRSDRLVSRTLELPEWVIKNCRSFYTSQK